MNTLTTFELSRFFSAIVTLLVAAHFFGYLFQRLRLPKVVGEILGGLVLGPTVLGYLAPEIYRGIFTAFATEEILISAIHWMGLVLLMFVSGFQVERSVNKQDRKLIGAVLITGTFLPFLLGLLVTNFFNVNALIGSAENKLALTIVISIALAITSIPVISKIFIDLNIVNTRFAKIVIATATLEDILLWVALAVATSLVASTIVTIQTVSVKIGITIIFFLASLVLAPKILHWISKSRFNFILKSSPAGYILVICFLFATLASLLNINVVFGALLAGVLVGAQSDKWISNVQTTIKQLSLGFFIPIYFAVVGLKLDLIHQFDLRLFLSFLLIASLIKILSTMVGAHLGGEKLFSAFNLGIAMNTRGGPGIVLATVALEAAIISEVFFTTLVMTAIVTSLIAGWWFTTLTRRSNVELLKS